MQLLNNLYNSVKQTMFQVTMRACSMWHSVQVRQPSR
jgi:hypothetical protein